MNNGNAKAFVPKNIEDIIIPIKVCLTSFCDGTLPRIIDANCKRKIRDINPLNAELNPICHLLALLAHPIFHVSRIRVKNKSFTESNSSL